MTIGNILAGMDNLITQAIQIAGLGNLAIDCGVTYQALRKWERAQRLPRTDWTGETDYASAIDQATAGQISRHALRTWSELTYQKQKEAA
jgi:hypothetical protein